MVQLAGCRILSQIALACSFTFAVHYVRCVVIVVTQLLHMALVVVAVIDSSGDGAALHQ